MRRTKPGWFYPICEALAGSFAYDIVIAKALILLRAEDTEYAKGVSTKVSPELRPRGAIGDWGDHRG